MKIEARRMEHVLRYLPQLHVVCLYGDDGDMVRECARRLVLAETGVLDDPFRISYIDGDDKEGVVAALNSPSLANSRSVVWVRHTTERLLPAVEQALHDRGVLLIVEYAAATAKSRLRGLVERHASGCIIACYPQASLRREAIRGTLAELGVRASDDVIARLVEQAEREENSGRSVGLAAALYCRPNTDLSLADVEAVYAKTSVDELAAALHAGLQGKLEELDLALTALLAEGASTIGLLRSSLLNLQRLRAMALIVADGNSVAEAGRAMRPPMFFHHEREIASILARWSIDGLEQAALATWDAERTSKAVGIPQESVCREALYRVATQGGR